MISEEYRENISVFAKHRRLPATEDHAIADDKELRWSLPTAILPAGVLQLDDDAPYSDGRVPPDAGLNDGHAQPVAETHLRERRRTP